ncbi:uncharacterized protein LOC141618767 [Silene latifolia]|uniref:uncharacterized protein LOC141618767 n=1 Tax=Silene latifolia TaxID=37657 RepID=UPI003D76CD2E
MRKVRERLDGYFGMEVDSVGRSGGLAFLWKREVDCEFVSASNHHMDFKVRGEGGEWRITGFYGWPAVSDRHLSWELLRLLGRQSSLPWVCIEDYNEVLLSTEMKGGGGGGSRPQWQMNNFRAVVDECGLRDVPWEGCNFSFDNGQAGEANRQSMIDRAMCTTPWLDLFPYARLFYLNREWSDHAPIRLVFNYRVSEVKQPRPFRFEQIWVGAEGCGEAVARGIAKGRGCLATVLEECARELGMWKRTNINKIGRDIENKNKQLHKLNTGDRSPGNVAKRKKLIFDIANLRKQEEQYWRQRSRALWLKDEDRNTTFFHTRARERKRKNHIASLIDDDGIHRTGDAAVSMVANKYFEELFTTMRPGNIDSVLQGFGGRVIDDMNVELRREYSEEEVVEALNQMHPLKAPGPDGMNGLFFQTFWSDIGPEVVRTVLPVLKGELSPRALNKTNIVLIPKKKAPDKIRDFRPISLCNVLYKLVSKVLVNRLKRFLGDIVSVNQSAFTPGRIISDNVMIAFELFHYMKNSRSTDGFMAIKLDMAKAYDRVEWCFLHKVLVALGFEAAWINRVMACLVSVEKTTVSFSKGVEREKRVEIANRLGFVEVAEQARYLGLPTVIGRSKKVLTDIIRDKLCIRLQGWLGKLLSRAGKEVLIKAVANSLPTYVMSVFKIPASFCDELRALVSRFWWGHEEGKRGISWVSWKNLTQRKGCGGMGFRDFTLFNLSLLGKQAWRLVMEPGSLWAQILRAKYFPTGDFMTAGLGGNPSYTWRGILEARKVLDRGLRRRIGDGLSTRVWSDAWIPKAQSGRVLSPCGPGIENMLVADLMKDHGWRHDQLESLFLPFERSRIANIRLSLTRPCDTWFWQLEKDGVYSVKSAYRELAVESFSWGSDRLSHTYAKIPFGTTNECSI